MAKRGVDVRLLDFGTPEKISGDRLKQLISVKNGIESTLAQRLILWRITLPQVVRPRLELGHRVHPVRGAVVEHQGRPLAADGLDAEQFRSGRGGHLAHHVR